MLNGAHFSYTALVFDGKMFPEEATIVGYAAIIYTLTLSAPMPSRISIISQQNKKMEDDQWILYPKSYLPNDNLAIGEIEALYKHLVFALKYEGINLLVFKRLTEHYSVENLEVLIGIEPTGIYARKIWFLIEWLSGKIIDSKQNLVKKSYINLVDDSLQFTIEGIKSTRHLIINNLPGTINFCPLIYKTAKLKGYIERNIAQQQITYLQGIRKEILQRAAAFLLLKDSKASFTIEGESPKSKRAARWGQAIGQAGSTNLSKEELYRLQQLVIENPRFLQLGYRQKGGFVGEHDRNTGEPLPDHISAKWQDIETLMDGLLLTEQLLTKNTIDPVIAAAIIAFGFVFIHPFEDGNGRLHRYLMHHILAKKQFTQQGIIFPVSAAILNKIVDYRKVLEAYSLPLLDYIDWKETKNHNVEVENDTIDFYRYFDATKQAEFMYDCVQETIEQIIPAEVVFLEKYDAFKREIDDVFEMPDSLVSLLMRFLTQNNGTLSKRAREKEFAALSEMEIAAIEKVYQEIFG